jgi:dTMP kinase
LGDYATGGLTPDLTIFLDIDPREGLQRKQDGAIEEWNRMEDQALEFHQAARNGYLKLARETPQRWLVVDASQETTTVHNEIMQRVEALRAQDKSSSKLAGTANTQ